MNLRVYDIINVFIQKKACFCSLRTTTSAESAYRLKYAHAIGISQSVWTNMQAQHDWTVLTVVGVDPNDTVVVVIIFFVFNSLCKVKIPVTVVAIATDVVRFIRIAWTGGDPSGLSGGRFDYLGSSSRWHQVMWIWKYLKIGLTWVKKIYKLFR